MGRSQVLYNRTKGRYKSRGGGGRGGRGGEPGVDGTGSKKRQGRIQEKGDYHLDDDDMDYQAPPKQHQQQVDEAMILLADASMSGQRNAFYDRAKKEREDKEAAAYSILEAGGSINVPSMAATFRTMKQSERLCMPEHLVSLAFRKPEDFDNDDFAASGMEHNADKNAVEDDAQSYTSVTIAGTRNRATILSDGQVEVRPKAGDTSVVAEQDESPSDPPPDAASIRPVGSTASTSKHIIMQMISEDGPDEDKYLVLQASTSDGSGGGGGGLDPEETGRVANVTKPEPPNEADQLGNWLDDSILAAEEKAEPKTAERPTTTEQASPANKGGRLFEKKSKIQSKSPTFTAKDDSKGTKPVAKTEVKSSTKTPNSPFSRRQYQKQRHRQYQKTAEAEESSASMSTGDTDEEEAVRKAATATSYDVYSVDSGGKMYDSDDNVGKGKKQSSAAKKNAMRDYVVNTTHQRTSKVKAAPAPKAGEDDGDLSEWLDSVI